MLLDNFRPILSDRSVSEGNYVNIPGRTLADCLAIFDEASVDPLKTAHNPNAGQLGAIVEKPAQDNQAFA